jgi:hypothetical protein
MARNKDKPNNTTFIDWTKTGEVTGNEFLPPFTEADQVISRQMDAARRARSHWEGEWQANEASLFDTGAEGGAIRGWLTGFRDVNTAQESDPGSSGDVTDNFMGINLSNRNCQLIHSQLMSNTPVVMATPVSDETKDKDSAKGAEAVTTYGRKQYKIDNRIGMAMMNCFVYGTALLKQIYDGSLGSYVMDQKSGGFKHIGDHRFAAVRIWDFYIDPNASCLDDAKWAAERMFVPLEECIKFFGEDNELILKSYVVDSSAVTPADGSLLHDVKFGTVEIFERWEPGTPENGYLGRLTYHLRDGRVVKSGDSPCAHPWYPDTVGRKALRGRFPYSAITYEDIPNSFWGRSPAAKCARAQNVLNAAYMVVLQTAQNMGVPHLVCNKGSLGENQDEAFTNNSINIIPLDLSGEAGGTMPFTLKAAETSSDVKELIAGATSYINDAWGVTDALLGKQSRETSGITTQLSIMQGSMIRERLFEKYIYFVEDIYQLFLADAAYHWKEGRLIQVVGENSTIEAQTIKGAMINSGYVLRVERGTLFALDPITRQEQIMNQLPLLQAAGVDPRYTLRQLRIADYRSIYTKFDMADNRAKLIIESLKDDYKKQPKIYKHEDHIGISAYMVEYEMTQEFNELDEEIKDAIEKHIDMRLEMEAKNRTPAPAPAGGGAPAAPGGANPLAAMFGGQVPGAPPKVGPV